MASATRKTVEKTITEDVIVLELTKSEANWLRGYLGSCSQTSQALPIYTALEAPAESDDRPIEVGDKVRILKANTSDSYNGRVGKLGRIDDDDPHVPYRVDLHDGDYEWAITVERVND